MKNLGITVVLVALIIWAYYMLTQQKVSKNEVSIFNKGQVEISLDPSYHFEFDTMRAGVIMHHDRPYKYDLVPKSIENGLLFRGIHRQDSGTSIHISLQSPTDIYFVFHVRKDGGYTDIFSRLKGWKREFETPQYDIKGGVHGLDMLMYKMPYAKGIIEIPRSTSDLGCFNIVFTEPKEEQ